MSLVLRAALFAANAHKFQKRKFNGEPYVNHCIRVAERVSQYTSFSDVLAAALLHDTIEDCGVTAEQLQEEFGTVVSALVVELTNPSKQIDGNRATRKAIDREHLSRISYYGKTVKLADVWDNSSDIAEQDPGFGIVFTKECSLLLPHLIGGHHILYDQVSKNLDTLKQKLNITV